MSISVACATVEVSDSIATSYRGAAVDFNPRTQQSHVPWIDELIDSVLYGSVGNVVRVSNNTTKRLRPSDTFMDIVSISTILFSIK